MCHSSRILISKSAFYPELSSHSSVYIFGAFSLTFVMILVSPKCACSFHRLVRRSVIIQGKVTRRRPLAEAGAPENSTLLSATRAYPCRVNIFSVIAQFLNSPCKAQQSCSDSVGPTQRVDFLVCIITNILAMPMPLNLQMCAANHSRVKDY